MQLALTYSATHAGAVDWQEELAWFRRVVDLLGHKHVAAELDLAPSHLTDALLERERKAVKGEWIAKVRRLCNEPQRREYLAIVCPSLGYEVPKPLRARTPEERLADLEDRIAERFGAAGQQLLDEVRR